MEVHAHTHAHPKKTWKEYFWEFLMLFLAVFCGFLAENFREGYVERHREREYIHSYIEDLKTDTANINAILKFRGEKMGRMDSLMHLLETKQIKGHERDIYFFARTLVRTFWFRSNDRTITQLKSSGSLRLIRNEQAADSMMSYEKLVENIMQNQEDDRLERNLANETMKNMFNPFIFDKMVDLNGVNRPESDPPLRSNDPGLQLDLAYFTHQLKGSNFILLKRLQLLKEKAVNAIHFLEKEYHLD